MKENFLRRLYFVAVALFLAAPIIVVAGVSVNEKQDLAFPPKGFSLVESLSPVVDQATRGVVVGLNEPEEQKLLALLDKAVMATMQLHAERKARRRGPGVLQTEEVDVEPTEEAS